MAALSVAFKHVSSPCQTASLANILFFAVLTDSEINEALAIKIIFWKKKIYSLFSINKKSLLTDMGSRGNSFHMKQRK